MTFNYDQAQKIVDHYQFLKGQYLDNDKSLKITSLYIFPFPQNDFYAFFNYHRFFSNNKDHLINVNADMNKVQVFLLHFNEPILIKKDIDEYLTENNIEKIY